MFKNLFNQRKYSSATGFLKFSNNELIPINDPKGGSINEYIEAIGFPANHIHTVDTFDSDKIACLGFITLTIKLIFVLTKDAQTNISYSDVLKTTKTIDLDFEYSNLNVEDILQEGIEAENFDLQFVKSILELTPEGKNLYKCEKFGLYFHFVEDILRAFSSSDWEHSATKWMKVTNRSMVESMIIEAKRFQRNEIEAMEEVNSQTEAFMNVPNAMNNEFLSFHKNNQGNINFINLLIAHYAHDFGQDEFLFINKGRFEKLITDHFELDILTMNLVRMKN